MLHLHIEFKKNSEKDLKKLNYGPKDKIPLQEGEKHKLVEYSTSIIKQNVDYVLYTLYNYKPLF